MGDLNPTYTRLTLISKISGLSTDCACQVGDCYSRSYSELTWTTTHKSYIKSYPILDISTEFQQRDFRGFCDYFASNKNY